MGSQQSQPTTRPASRRFFLLGVVCGVVGLFLLQILINRTTVADRIIAPLIVSETAGPADAIVAMGAGVVGQCAPNLNGVRRVVLAVRQWRQKRAPVILFTGGPSQGSCPVAVAMANLAAEMDVPPSSILVETASHNTRENGVLSAPLLRARGVRRVLVVTDRLHMRRAAGVFAGLGFEVERASVPIYEGHWDNVDMLGAGAREAVALALYRARGWLDRPAGEGAGEGHGSVGSGGREHGAATPTAGREMTTELQHPQGPVVVLGASYAGGWPLKEVAGAPVLNRGVSGQQSFEMLERFDRDVLAARPRAVILWGFINDIFRAQDMEKSVARIRDSYVRMIQQSRQAGIEPILATEVTVRSPRTWSETAMVWIGDLLGKVSYQDRVNQQVIETNRWLADLGKKERVLVLDFQSTLAEERGRRRREFAQDDGSHISAAGYEALTAYARPLLESHMAGSRR